MARPDAGQHLAESLLVKGLEQIIHGADLEGFERVGVVGGDEYQGRQVLRFQSTRQLDAVQRIHLDVEKQKLRFRQANGGERGLTVGEFADHA